MVATTDSQLHTHTVTIDAAILNATTAQMVTTSSAGPTPGHTHMVMLTPGNLTTLRGGGMVDITSTNASRTRTRIASAARSWSERPVPPRVADP